MITIDFFAYKDLLELKRAKGKRWIKCVIRQKFLVLTPEEMVRQLLIHYLILEKGYAKKRIAVEKGLIVNGLRKRWDILIYDSAYQPYLLVECKAPNVAINQTVLEQIGRYNLVLKVPYLLVSNSITTFCHRIDFENQSFELLDEVPENL